MSKDQNGGNRDWKAQGHCEFWMVGGSSNYKYKGGGNEITIFYYYFDFYRVCTKGLFKRRVYGNQLVFALDGTS